MAHLITPITIDGDPYCCQPATRRTVAILTGAATELAPNQWEIYRAYQDDTIKEGSVKFGICCATNIEVTLNGKIETLNDGYDWISVYHNGAEVFFHQSAGEEDSDVDDTVIAGPFVVSLPLEDRPCGHIIEITGSTGDGIANNNVFWQASVVIG